MFVLGVGVLLCLRLSSGASNVADASRYQACPEERLSKCFSDAYMHMEKMRSSSSTGLSCRSYDLYVLCFSFAECGVQRSAAVAQSVYKLRREEPSPPPPLQAFIAVFGHVKAQCSYGCSQETERFCAARMTVADKTANHALMLELRGQQMQVELGMQDFESGCKEIGQTLRDWAAFRIRLCDFNSAFCFCKKLQLGFRGRCNFQCSTLRAESAAAFNLSSSLYLVIIIIASL